SPASRRDLGSARRRARPGAAGNARAGHLRGPRSAGREPARGRGIPRRPDRARMPRGLVPHAAAGGSLAGAGLRSRAAGESRAALRREVPVPSLLRGGRGGALPGVRAAFLRGPPGILLVFAVALLPRPAPRRGPPRV